ncbi:MAG TPA: hypothetical protein PLF81_15350 [Candidatus Anammoximicrobium sp.]|nr:hypothetical protein [Candidatus Anammoximicrobium sp.]
MTSLTQYLSQSNWLASLQFLVYLGVLYRLLERCLLAAGLFGWQLTPQQRVLDPVLDTLARLCLGMGLLLTFSGLYGYIGSGTQGDQASLLLALGSSALGYSAWTFCAVGGVVDAVRRRGGETSEIEEADGEQEPAVHFGSERGSVGGPADRADLAADAVFGGLDGYQRLGGLDNRGGGVGADLAGAPWPDGLVAGHGPAAGAYADPPTPAGDGRAKRRPGNDPPAV